MREGRYRDLLHPSVRVRAGSGASRDIVTHQVAPGRYEATVVADATRDSQRQPQWGGCERRPAP